MPTLADFNDAEGLRKFAPHAQFEDIPFNRIAGIGQIPVAFALLGLLKKKGNQNIIFPYARKKQALKQNIAYFSPCGYEMNEQLEGLKKLLQEAKKDNPNGGRIVIPLAFQRGVPHVVTAVIDFDKHGNVNCFMFDPISKDGYSLEKEEFKAFLGAIFGGRIDLSVNDIRYEKNNMNACAVWAHCFHEFLIVNQSLPLADMQNQFNQFAKRKGYTEENETKFINQQYNEMQQHNREFIGFVNGPQEKSHSEIKVSPLPVNQPPLSPAPHTEQKSHKDIPRQPEFIPKYESKKTIARAQQADSQFKKYAIDIFANSHEISEKKWKAPDASQANKIIFSKQDEKKVFCVEKIADGAVLTTETPAAYKNMGNFLHSVLTDDPQARVTLTPGKDIDKAIIGLAKGGLDMSKVDVKLADGKQCSAEDYIKQKFPESVDAFNDAKNQGQRKVLKR